MSKEEQLLHDTVNICVELGQHAIDLRTASNTIRRELGEASENVALLAVAQRLDDMHAAMMRLQHEIPTVVMPVIRPVPPKRERRAK